MARKLQVPGAMRASTLLIVFATATSTFAGVAIAQQRDDGQPPTVKEVMTSMTVPSSDQIFESAFDTPTTDEGWAKLRRATLTLAESGRLLMTTKLAKDTSTWIDRARSLVEEAERASHAADAKDRKALEAVSDTIYATCKTCHDRYMPGAP